MTFEQIIRNFAESDVVPVAAVKAALADPRGFVDKAIPLLRRVATETSNQQENEALVIVVHVLAEIGDRRAFAPMLELARLPEIGDLLDDTITETMGSVVIALTSDGDATALQAVLEDRDVDEFARSSVFQAWRWLALNGKIDREEAHRFLHEYPTRIGLEGDDFGWSDWVDAVAVLRFEDMADYARAHLPTTASITRSFAGPGVVIEDFNDALQSALADPDAWRSDHQYQPFDDTIGELSRWHGYSEEYRREQSSVKHDNVADHDFLSGPYIATNLYRDVGRNDPCPCGSGKKFKKCCLGEAA